VNKADRVKKGQLALKVTLVLLVHRELEVKRGDMEKLAYKGNKEYRVQLVLVENRV
jgi:hypothetical protein